jgi:hypothetical protein
MPISIIGIRIVIFPDDLTLIFCNDIVVPRTVTMSEY